MDGWKDGCITKVSAHSAGLLQIAGSTFNVTALNSKSALMNMIGLDQNQDQKQQYRQILIWKEDERKRVEIEVYIYIFVVNVGSGRTAFIMAPVFLLTYQVVAYASYLRLIDIKIIEVYIDRQINIQLLVLEDGRRTYWGSNHMVHGSPFTLASPW